MESLAKQPNLWLIPTEVLIAAREWFSQLNTWCRGTFAKNSNGDKTYIFSTDTVSCCLAGELVRELVHKGFKDLVAVSEKNSLVWLPRHDLELLFNEVYEWNDAPGRTRQDVVNLLDAEIAKRR